MNSYNFSTTKTVNSVKLPGVVFQLRKMTERRRLKLMLSTGPINAEIREKIEQQRNLREQTPPPIAQILQLDADINVLVTEKLNPAKIAWGVAGISGLSLDGEPATMDNLLDWPSDLIEEIIELIDGGTALNEVEQKNSASPTTSGAQTGGRENSTSARIVN